MRDTIKKNDGLNIRDQALRHKVTKLSDMLSNVSKNKDKVLLCDVSGSMGTNVNQEQRAIDIVRYVVQQFPGCNLWTFSTGVRKVAVIGNPEDSTNMAGAFQEMKKQRYKEIYLLTDGRPDSEHDALNAAQGLKINIIYIGPQPTPDFLFHLANVTGGKMEDVELIKLGSVGANILESKIRGLLG